jgi:hypothetical protein
VARLEGDASVDLPDGSKRVQRFDEAIPVQGNVRNYEIAAVVGAALEFELSKSTLVLDGRYQIGLTSVDAGSKDIYNNVISITVAFMAPFQR